MAVRRQKRQKSPCPNLSTLFQKLQLHPFLSNNSSHFTPPPLQKTKDSIDSVDANDSRDQSIDAFYFSFEKIY
ncbi:hypothetical protein SLEP1_g11329 [Rubroshorea leprosula]|uniref:Uncharacterized protein n=1 Tax=Rubroshorea leprosula TaxID=152421 RepID=A0AAV5IGS2_9ROSI|nr:hypothetical protein SLEP1_g11329 [Rubroshorea leprosula]